MLKRLLITAMAVFMIGGLQAQVRYGRNIGTVDNRIKNNGGVIRNAGDLALKTNLLYDATTTINLGLEIGLADQWTLDLSGNYNPWTFSDNRKMKLWLAQPELRWWTCRRFSGHFWGLHLHGGQFNFGGMLPWGFRTGKMFGVYENREILNHRYQGWLAGAGLGYGYHWVIGKRWGLEAEIGLGYAYINYEKFTCTKCSEKLDDGALHYIGPTKASISLVYIIK